MGRQSHKIGCKGEQNEPIQNHRNLRTQGAEAPSWVVTTKQVHSNNFKRSKVRVSTVVREFVSVVAAAYPVEAGRPAVCASELVEEASRRGDAQNIRNVQLQGEELSSPAKHQMSKCVRKACPQECLCHFRISCQQSESSWPIWVSVNTVVQKCCHISDTPTNVKSK